MCRNIVVSNVECVRFDDPSQGATASRKKVDMFNPPAPTRTKLIAASVFTAVALCLAPAAGALASEPATNSFGVQAAINATGSEVLASTAWETTGAVDQDGVAVELTDAAVVNFVGWAYYKTDGTFTMYNLDDTPKMQGDWSVNPEGTERTLVAKDADGAVLFERVVPITELTGDVFTYRVVPDAAAPEVYYDIIHTPTTHAEPATAAPADDATTGSEVPAAADGTEELAETGIDAAPIVAAAVGIVAVLGGAAIFMTARRRRANIN